MAKRRKVSKVGKVSKASKETVVFTKPQEKQQASLFPKIYRFITESWKFILSSFVSGLIIIGILIQGTQLYNNFQEQQRIKAKRGSVENELAFWKKQLTKYKDSRDIYFRIAALEYELGDKESARVDLEKVLEIDPNLKEGREMEKILE